MPEAEAQCRLRLHALGVTFTERPPEESPLGCSLPHPLLVTRLSGTIALEPSALINCATAEAVATFTRDVIVPVGRQEIGAELQAIEQASGYVCRPRHGTRTLSEHAFGNALDMSRFVFAGRAPVDVAAAPGKQEEKFLDELRKRACGPFKTVLGPGSDADHATHLHLDLAQRKNGSTFCQ